MGGVSLQSQPVTKHKEKNTSSFNYFLHVYSSFLFHFNVKNLSLENYLRWKLLSEALFSSVSASIVLKIDGISQVLKHFTCTIRSQSLNFPSIFYIFLSENIFTGDVNRMASLTTLVRNTWMFSGTFCLNSQRTYPLFQVTNGWEAIQVQGLRHSYTVTLTVLNFSTSLEMAPWQPGRDPWNRRHAGSVFHNQPSSLLLWHLSSGTHTGYMWETEIFRLNTSLQKSTEAQTGWNLHPFVHAIKTNYSRSQILA